MGTRQSLFISLSVSTKVLFRFLAFLISCILITSLASLSPSFLYRPYVPLVRLLLPPLSFVFELIILVEQSCVVVGGSR